MLERDDGQVEISENSVPAPITTREREVAELIAQGLSNEQIAERLVLTPGTVANHVAHILEKMRLQARVQIAVKVELDLGVRSTIAAPILGSGRAPGVLLASSRQPEQFTEDQLQLLQFVAYWLGLVARERALARKSDREDGRKAD